MQTQTNTIETGIQDETVAKSLLIKPEELDHWFHQKFSQEMDKYQKIKSLQ